MEFFRNTNIDFLGKKWYFLAFSLIFSVAGILSMAFWHHVPLGVDFKGGTLVYVRFTQQPPLDQIRRTLDAANLHNARLQTYGPPSENQVLISLDIEETSESALDRGKNQIIKALEAGAQQPAAAADKQDLQNASFESVAADLMQKDPLHLGTDAEARYNQYAQAVVNFRDKDPRHAGVLYNLDELAPLLPQPVLQTMKQDFFLSDFAVRNVEIVGPQVGKQLQRQALLATLYSLLGMLVYLWFRFEWIYGLGAVVACFHDTIITVGAFSLTNKEISLTVIAAILTLIGYSMNDTIVVYDRMRENIKLMRRERLSDIVNRSINQTLSRTILTSGLTFLTVLSLFLFGGEVLHGFSFALVIGILIGTYSSIAVAAPMVVAYQDWRAARGGRGPMPVSVDQSRKEKVRAKA